MTTTHVTARFHVKSWDEKPYDEAPGLPKLTRASVKVEYEGDLEGSGATEYLMAHRDDSTADFVEIQRITGTIAGRKGSFVLKGTGSYDGKTARGEQTIVAGSGTGQLQGISGRGQFSAEKGPEGQITLELEL